MQDGSFDVAVGGEDGDGLASGTEDFMDKMRDSRFSGRAGDTN